MRTTVTLDSDVERLLKNEAHRTRQSFKQVLNKAVRQVLRKKSKLRPVLIEPRSLGFRSGVDFGHLGKVADELEIEAHLVSNKDKSH